MNLHRALAPAFAPGRAARLSGVVVGLVTNNQDPEGRARVKVRFPWLTDEDESHWARLAVPMAGPDCGTYFLPEVGDEVLVAFAHGDLRYPFVVGALWNGVDAPPESNDTGNNDVNVIKSRSGHVIRLNDKAGAETVEIIDGSGENKIVIDMAAKVVTVRSADKVVVAAATIELGADSDIRLESGGKVVIKANGIEMESSAGAKLGASGSLLLRGATVNIN